MYRIKVASQLRGAEENWDLGLFLEASARKYSVENSAVDNVFATCFLAVTMIIAVVRIYD